LEQPKKSLSSLVMAIVIYVALLAGVVYLYSYNHKRDISIAKQNISKDKIASKQGSISSQSITINLDKLKPIPAKPTTKKEPPKTPPSKKAIKLEKKSSTQKLPQKPNPTPKFKPAPKPINDTKLAKLPPKKPQPKTDPIPSQAALSTKSIAPKPKSQNQTQKKISKQIKKRYTKTKRKNKFKVKRGYSHRSKRGGSRKNRGHISKYRFFAMIKSRINRHKYYPPAARKRGIKGRVRVHFVLTSSGRVRGVGASGPSALRRAAINAVRSAFPIDTSRAPITLPRSMSITLVYR